MKKHTEKQPVDDLFARKLGNMSLPPSPDGFARLQARMGQQSERETRVIFWQNPAIQRYMAIAACLLLMCLFGWLYLSTDTPGSGTATVAVNKSAASSGKKHAYEQPKSNLETEVVSNQPVTEREISSSTGSETTNSVLAGRGKLVDSKSTNGNNRLATVAPTIRENKPVSEELPDVTPTKSVEQIAKAEVNTPLAQPMPEKQVATTTDKPTPVAERVLIVTIAEPKALVAARQAVTGPVDEKDAVVAADKPEKESKVANVWQQMKRMKQGEIFARKDAADDERGLLGRAYSGLKHTLDKDKSTKQ